ncbi:MAG: hypothetical protein ACI9MR_002547 [Myxococcota bacterium]|jgi:hypothetical protein
MLCGDQGSQAPPSTSNAPLSVSAESPLTEVYGRSAPNWSSCTALATALSTEGLLPVGS